MSNNKLHSFKPGLPPPEPSNKKKAQPKAYKHYSLNNGQYGTNHREALIDRILAMPEPIVKKKRRK